MCNTGTSQERAIQVHSACVAVFLGSAAHVGVGCINRLSAAGTCGDGRVCLAWFLQHVPCNCSLGSIQIVSLCHLVSPSICTSLLYTVPAESIFLIYSFVCSYVFSSFFKALFLASVLGIFHGLAALPVLLKLMGGDNIKVQTEALEVSAHTSIG